MSLLAAPYTLQIKISSNTELRSVILRVRLKAPEQETTTTMTYPSPLCFVARSLSSKMDSGALIGEGKCFYRHTAHPPVQFCLGVDLLRTQTSAMLLTTSDQSTFSEMELVLNSACFF